MPTRSVATRRHSLFNRYFRYIIMNLKQKKAVALFYERSEYLLHGMGYEPIRLVSFWDYIYYRSYINTEYYFEETQSKEYKWWLKAMQKKKSEAKIKYPLQYDFRYNAILVGIRREQRSKSFLITDDFSRYDEVLLESFVIGSPISYVGRNRTVKNARYIYALVFDLDGVGMEQIADLNHQIKKGFLPAPNIISNSGHGLHLYYILQKPIALFSDVVPVLNKLKIGLTNVLWNMYTSTLKERQYQSIFQGFRMPDTPTKLKGVNVAAFLDDTVKSYSIHDLNSFCEEKVRLSEEEVNRCDHSVFNPHRLSKQKASELYPEWYERVIVQGDKTKSRWHIKRALYDWWLRTLRSPFTEIKVGHRYFCLLALAMYAIKCDISEEELTADLQGLVEQMDKLTESEDNHFTQEDAEDALYAYKENYCTFPKAWIERLTGLTLPTNRRNGRKQNLHLKIARVSRDILQEEKGTKWDDNNGRPKGSTVSAANSPKYKRIKEWRKANPENNNKSDCARELGFSRTTVTKWWKIEDDNVAN